MGVRRRVAFRTGYKKSAGDEARTRDVHLGKTGLALSNSAKFVDGFLRGAEEFQPVVNCGKIPGTKWSEGAAPDGKLYWLTPPALMSELQSEFHFDFDPCPYPVPDGFDGLECEWGASNYVNPPFGAIMHQGKKKGPTAWARKAISENKKGKRVVLVYPIDKWILELIAVGAKIRNLGDVKWHAIEDNAAGSGTGRHVAAFILE